MSSIPPPKYCARLLVPAWIGAALIIIGTFAFLLSHETVSAMPSPSIALAQKPFDHMDARLGAADSMRDLVGLLVTLSLGLAATIGFAIRDGIGTNPCLRAANPVLIAIFFYFFAQVIVYAYEIYGAIAVQLVNGGFFEGRIEDVLIIVARSVLWLSVIAIAILAMNTLWAKK